MNKCSFGLHNWEKWVTYRQQMFHYIATGFLKYDTERPHEAWEIRQCRTCKDCGKNQDRLVKKA